jgi:hypothetical protein
MYSFSFFFLLNPPGSTSPEPPSPEHSASFILRRKVCNTAHLLESSFENISSDSWNCLLQVWHGEYHGEIVTSVNEDDDTPGHESFSYE